MSGAPNSAAGAAPARALPGSGDARRHLIVAIVNNRPGVLNRVASLMRARNFNIESLAVSVTERSDTCMTQAHVFKVCELALQAQSLAMERKALT